MIKKASQGIAESTFGMWHDEVDGIEYMDKMRVAGRATGYHPLEPVDWDFKDDTFHNQWQSYRTKKEPDLQKKVTHTYDEAGVYAIVVKVIDILGNDTTKVMEVLHETGRD